MWGHCAGASHSPMSRTVVVHAGGRRRVPVRPHAQAVVRYHIALSRLGFHGCHGPQLLKLQHDRQATTNISNPHNDGTGCRQINRKLFHAPNSQEQQNKSSPPECHVPMIQGYETTHYSSAGNTIHCANVRRKWYTTDYRGTRKVKQKSWSGPVLSKAQDYVMKGLGGHLTGH